MNALGKLLVILGALLAAAGLVLMLAERPGVRALLDRLPLFHLPGDIFIRREGFTFSFPIATCLVLSVVLTLIFVLFRR